MCKQTCRRDETRQAEVEATVAETDFSKSARRSAPSVDLPASYKFKYTDIHGNSDNGEDDHEVPEGAPADEQPMAVQQDGSCGLWAIVCTNLCAVDIIESKQSMHDELMRWAACVN